MTGFNSDIDMDKILLNYDLENREIFYELAYKTAELDKSYIKLNDLKRENFVLQTTLESLKSTNVDLENTLKHTSRQITTISMAPSRTKALADGSTKVDLLSLENKSLKEMLYKLQKEKDDVDQLNSRNDAKYKCILLNNEDLIKERNSLRENVESLTKAVNVKNKENSDLKLLKENIFKLDRKLKESTFYIFEIKKLEILNAKQQEDITYYRAYSDQLKDMFSHLKRTKPLNSVPSELGPVKHHYQHCAEEIESLKTDLMLKLHNERKANEVLIKIDNLMRNKYNLAKNELESSHNKNKSIEIDLIEINNKYKTATIALEEIENKYQIAKIDLEKKCDKMLMDIETQTEAVKQEKSEVMDLTSQDF